MSLTTSMTSQKSETFCFAETDINLDHFQNRSTERGQTDYFLLLVSLSAY